MRDRQEIEREMYGAREDLEQHLGELKHAVREKVDVPARMRHAVERGKDGVIRGYRRSIDFTKDRPVLVGGIAAGVVLGVVGVILLLRYRARNRPWWEKLSDAISP